MLKISDWFDADEDLTKYDPALYYFDPQAAARALDFFSLLHHVKGEWAGKELKLEKWEYRIIRDLFGWKRQSDNLRKHRSCYVEVPRKNGKSTLAAGVGLYLTFADKEPGAEVYSAAADRRQARVVFDLARQMVVKSQALSKRAEVFARTIFVSEWASNYEVLSADAESKHGYNPHGIIFDELHTQTNRKLWDTLLTGMGARRQPVLFAMTTAGYDRTTICWEVHQYAKKIIEGSVKDDSFLPVIYAASEKDDWKSPKTWKKANPNYGISVKEDFIERECKKAQEIPAFENVFKRLYLNVWTEQAERAIPMDRWDACSVVLPHDMKAAVKWREETRKKLAGSECFCGLDLSSTTDLSSFVAVFPFEKVPVVLAHFWIPQESLNLRVQRDRVPYDVWAQHGFITPTHNSVSNVIDYDQIRAEIGEFGQSYNMREIAADRWNASQLLSQLDRDGYTVLSFGQGFKDMNAPTKELLKLVLSGGLEHGGNPVLRWMASNLAVEQDAAGNLKPSKKKSTERIDGMVSLIMAIARALCVLPEEDSVYSGRGILTV